jgi:hypothetical protein
MTAPDVYEDPMPDAETVSTVQELAFVAQHAALHRDSDLFVRTFRRLIDEHFVHISVAFAVWCDNAIDAIASVSPDAARKDELLASAYRIESERGDSAQWGARILKARAYGDKKAFLSALAEMNGLTAKDKVLRVQALLVATSTAIAASQQFAIAAMADFDG